ncbi:SubName: Full=Uncharacterized protein {ECO:0000313/EMBL:CCA72978.1} [Serendipita indica DSM 11827]|uniref:Chromatin modification-related protein EAF7 n=1 Tax=Serendipita indica (strain DSM 11827) TaxID=1109443 RepID=G4TNT5_SERID|nr:SubName: Full=Uncharacterized protein {ECO:0000313/EMBL:CCA72978.1} [Serendipita indica DSM 11827]CCA72978.1 hypothetical protein PIIN_06933 [Serendipita indica DSM 11827]
MKVEKADTTQSPAGFLETLQGESAFFRALCDIRPVGLHREFHMLAIANHIQGTTGVYVPVAELWTKFETFYNPEILEGFEKPGYTLGSAASSSDEDDESEEEEEEEEDEDGENGSTTTRRLHARDDPKPWDDLEHHPFFRMEFELPTGPGWPPAPPSTTTGAASATTTTTGGRGHARKESVAVTSTTSAAPAASSGGRTTRAGKAAKASAPTAPAPTTTTNEEESESDLTDDEGADETSKDKDGSADAEEAEEDETKESVTEEQEPEPEQTGTRRSTRHARTATRETNVPPVRGTTKKKRG